jgi:hypothetical protein
MLSRGGARGVTKAELSATLIQRTTSQAPQRRYVLHRTGCSQEDEQLLRQRQGWLDPMRAGCVDRNAAPATHDRDGSDHFYGLDRSGQRKTCPLKPNRIIDAQTAGPADCRLSEGANYSGGSLRIVSGLAENTNSIFCDGPCGPRQQMDVRFCESRNHQPRGTSAHDETWYYALRVLANAPRTSLLTPDKRLTWRSAIRKFRSRRRESASTRKSLFPQCRRY